MQVCLNYLKKTQYYDVAKKEVEIISNKHSKDSQLLPPVMVTYQSFTVEYQRLGLPVWLLRDAFYNLPQLPTLPKKCDILPQLLSNSIDLIIDRMIDDIKIDGLNTVDGGIYDRSTQYLQNIQNNSI